MSRPRDNRPAKGTYLLVVSDSLDVRRTKFAALVRRGLNDVKIQRGWGITDVVKESGVGRTTLHRWTGGDWTEDPQAAKVRDFCDSVGVDVDQAFHILWPSRNRGRPDEPEPPALDPDIVRLLRKISDPNTPKFEREFIQESLRLLALRADQSPRTTRRT